MSEFYIVQNNPVVAYDQPGAIGHAVNAYQPGTKLFILKEDSGWLHTEFKTVIFKNSNIISYRQYLREHPDELIMSESIDPNIPKPLRKGLRALSSVLTTADTVRVHAGTSDVNSNSIVPADWSSDTSRLSVKEIKATTAVVYDSESGQQFEVPISSIDRFDPSSNEFTDVSTIATGGNKVIDKISDRAEAVVDSILDTADDVLTPGFVKNLDISNIRTVFGMPYQFLPWADNRLTNDRSNITPTSDLTKFGRKFAQKIVSRAPILVMQAGVPEFMRGFSKSETNTMWAALGNIGSAVSDELAQLVNTPGKYYSLRLAPDQYYEAVDQMCTAMASLLGIGDYKWRLPGAKDSIALADPKFTWLKASANKGFGFNAGSVGFYINSEPQVNEAFSNGTTQSQLAQKLNEIGRMASEIQFYLGGVTNATNVNFSGAVEGVTQMGSVSNGASGVRGLIDSLIDNVQTIMAGGRLIFPEIWSDHTFTRSYTVTIKLDTPDCDVLSVYMNILVPLAHILGFVLPRWVGSNNYISPLLVKAFYKSMFHIDMGIITDCQITKGDVGAWTQNGLPTQITVQLTIKDLYNVLAMASGIKGADILGNPGQLDYIANMCGINIDAPNITRSLRLWMALRSPSAILNRRVGELFQKWESVISQWWLETTNRIF